MGDSGSGSNNRVRTNDVAAQERRVRTDGSAAADFGLQDLVKLGWIAIGPWVQDMGKDSVGAHKNPFLQTNPLPNGNSVANLNPVA